MGRMFGTDGVRGIANKELTPELAFEIGQAGAYVLTGSTGKKPVILVGKDTRISGDILECALTAGLCSVGAKVVSAGVIPTPAIAYLVRRFGFDAGVMISASHNPFEHNGIKFFSGEGYKLKDETEEKIEAIILDKAEEVKRAVCEDIGHREEDYSLADEYIKFAMSVTDVRFDGIKIAIDCANGSASVTAKRALEGLGAEVFVTCDKPDGININKDCGSTHIENLAAFVKETKADVGLAFDGDADRVLAVDENGDMVDGDKIMAVCALDMRSRGKLEDNTVVATVMSNLGFFIMGRENGIDVERTKVGDRYVLERMKEIHASLGGEQSGHIIFLGENTTGDGLLSCLHLLQVMKETGKPLSELAKIMKKYPQSLINAKVDNSKKEHYRDFPEIVERIDALEKEFDGKGRVLIRPSGTEPLVRVMIEGEDQDVIQKKAEELADFIEKTMA